MRATTIGLDIAKSVFQVHGVDANGAVVIRKQLSRAQMLPFFKKQRACLIGIESCSTSHFWARALIALGHQVKLLPTQYVKPYVKRSKSDSADAEAICEAVTRPSMRFVPIKTKEAQSLSLLHRMRSQLISQRVALMGALRSGLAELGIVAAPGAAGEAVLLKIVSAEGDEIPESVKMAFVAMADVVRSCKAQLATIDRKIAEVAKRDDTCARLETIPGVGRITSSMVVAVAGDFSRFTSARHFAAWLGLTPRQNTSGGNIKLGHITKAGDKTLRSLFVMGSLTIVREAKARPEKALRWLVSLLERRPRLVAAVAMANKVARIVWALMVRGGTYRSMPVA
jgi:transposase